MNKVKLLFSEKLSRIYAMALVLIIPILIISNGLWRINIYQRNIDKSLTEKAALTIGIIASTMNQNLDDSTNLQTKINQIKENNTAISEITIIVPTANDYPVIASTSKDKIGVNLNDIDLISVWSDNATIVRSAKNTGVTKAEKYYLASTTIKDLSGNKEAILNVRINDSQIDSLNRAAINQSLVLLVITVFLIFLLLINYFRFFEYFVKFRKIQEVDKMKDEFISMVSHEVKTPLATIKGYLDMMIHGLTGKFDQEGKDHLVKVFANVQRLDILVTELLDVSRIEQGRMQFDMQPVDMNEIMKNVLIEYGDQAKNKGIEIENNLNKPLPPVFADPDRLQQIFSNLITNAIKYTVKGKITVLYTIDKNKINATVKDTGIGISQSDAKRLFERFYRIKNEKTMNISGTGLGLWIAGAIAKHMNGNISFKTRENEGSEFTLTLPIIRERNK